MDLSAERLQHLIDDGMRSSAMRGILVAILQKRDRSLRPSTTCSFGVMGVLNLRMVIYLMKVF